MNIYTDDRHAIAIVQSAFPSYRHAPSRLQVRDFCPIKPTSYWDGGSKQMWAIAKLDGAGASFGARENGTPFTDAVGEISDIPEGTALVCLTIGGRESAVLYVRPDNLQKLLPSTPTLTEDEWVVVVATAGLKSFARKERYDRNGLDTARVDAAKASLVAKGLIMKNGGITTDGRNAADACPKKGFILHGY